MHAFPFPTLFLLLCLGLYSPIFAQQQDAHLATQQLQQYLDRYGQVQLILESDYDPYLQGTRLPASHPQGQVLQLDRRHRYQRDDEKGIQRGHWWLYPEAGQLVFTDWYTQDQSRHTQQTFQVISCSNERLILVWQGRHGFVQRAYLLRPINLADASP